VTATIADPPPLHHLAPAPPALLRKELAVVAGQYTYFAVPIDPRHRGEVVIAVAATATATGSLHGGAGASASRGGQLLAPRGTYTHAAGGPGPVAAVHAATAPQLHAAVAARVDARYGRGLYTCDDLAAYGVDVSAAGTGAAPGPLAPLPPSPAMAAGVYPVVYASASCMYPTAADFTWRARCCCGRRTHVQVPPAPHSHQHSIPVPALSPTAIL
jgi:hypothetical protein